MTQLQVMICTYGLDGIQRVAKSAHPIMPEVEYIVGWQIDDIDASIPTELLNRRDFKIYRHVSKGLSKNRNYLLDRATAPLLLISDDDVCYNQAGLSSVIKAFEDFPKDDILTFRFASESGEQRNYPNKSFDLVNPAKGYYVASIEIAFRRDSINKNHLRFNERFGIGGKFIAGEENVFLNDCRRANLNGHFLPITICTHAGTTTSERKKNAPEFIQTKGAVFAHTHPFTWVLRMFAHALRETSMPRPKYIYNWIRGAFQELRHNI